MSFRVMVVDICAQRVQRSTTFFVSLATGNLSTVNTTCNGYLDTFSTHAHASLDSHLDCTTVRDTAFNLTADTIGYQTRIQLRALNLEDVDLDILSGNLLQLLLQLIHL
jgi:hypothetical protein